MKSTAELVRVKGVIAWVEEKSSIQLKAAEPDGSPVELNAQQARDLAQALAKLAQTLDSLSAQ